MYRISFENNILRLLFIAFFSGLFSCSANSASTGYSNPFELYPNGIEFQVSRNQEIIGKHELFFEKLEDKKFRVGVEVKFRVIFLGLSIYQYKYQSEAIWHRSNLIKLKAEQDDDGEKSEVIVFKREHELIIKTGDSEVSCDHGSIPSNHWNANILKKEEIINTSTGELSSINIKNLGKEKIRAQGIFIFANKYSYTGDVEALAWYSDAGNWVKLKFKGKDGSDIEYECIKCGIISTIGQKFD